jgi:hypothetical protein
VNADGVGYEGPTQIFAQGGGDSEEGAPGAVSMTNFNGNFVISVYNTATTSSQIIETGICP